MSMALVSDLERLHDQWFWRDFAPDLHVVDVAFLTPQTVFAIDAAGIENGRTLLRREGYFEIPPPDWGLPIADMSPWLDFRLPPLEVKLPEIEAQTHRRFLKTHLPLDAYVFSPKAKYVYIARDGRDCCWSMYNHHVNMVDWVYEEFNKLPYLGPVVTPPKTDDLHEYYMDWFVNDGVPFWPFWENIRTWWETRNLANVHFIHYQNLKDDMAG